MNGMKTTMLLAALTALFMGLGYTLGGSGGAVLALLVAAGMHIFSFWTADNIVMSKLYRPGSVCYVSKSGGMSNIGRATVPLLVSLKVLYPSNFKMQI